MARTLALVCINANHRFSFLLHPNSFSHIKIGSNEGLVSLLDDVFIAGPTTLFYSNVMSVKMLRITKLSGRDNGLTQASRIYARED